MLLFTDIAENLRTLLTVLGGQFLLPLGFLAFLAALAAAAALKDHLWTRSPAGKRHAALLLSLQLQNLGLSPSMASSSKLPTSVLPPTNIASLQASPDVGTAPYLK